MEEVKENVEEEEKCKRPPTHTFGTIRATQDVLGKTYFLTEQMNGSPFHFHPK